MGAGGEGSARSATLLLFAVAVAVAVAVRSAPLATVVSLPTARAARPGAQRRDTPECAVAVVLAVDVAVAADIRTAATHPVEPRRRKNGRERAEDPDHRRRDRDPGHAAHPAEARGLPGGDGDRRAGGGGPAGRGAAGRGPER